MQGRGGGRGEEGVNTVATLKATADPLSNWSTSCSKMPTQLAVIWEGWGNKRTQNSV